MMNKSSLNCVVRRTAPASAAVLILHAYSPKLRVQTDCSTGGRTKQSFKDECDINNIMARFKRTGVLDFAAKNEPRYGDCTGVDFAAAMNLVANANSMFQELPSHIRARFENDPYQFLNFVHDDRNMEEARELGLLSTPVPQGTPAQDPPVEPATDVPAPRRERVKPGVRDDPRHPADDK